MRPMHSRALALLLAMVMVLSMIPVTAFAEGNATTWTKVDFSAITAEDTVAITMSKDGITYVLPTTAAGSSGQPMAEIGTVEGNTLTTTGDGFGWTIAPVEGGYTIQCGDGFSFKFFDATLLSDHTLAPDEEAEEAPEIDWGSGFTAAQIAEMRSQQEKTIKDLEFSIKMAEAEYKIAQTEVSDGNVYAQIDGVVVSLLTQEEAEMMQSPILKVSAGGGFYVEGTVSELDRDSLVIGQEVTINDWYSGMMYTGYIESLGDYPSADGYWNGMGNPTASYYPFRVFVEESADLQSGSYVSIMFAAADAQHGVYLENPFIRTEGGRSYVYVRGEDGKLEQRFVTIGKSLWGSYTEILEGLGEEDFVAFPYGKNVKPGAETVESDISVLYE